MSATIELPVWLVALAGVLALVALVDRLLTPAVRWVLHHRVNRAIDELSTRLKLKIRLFGLTGRRIVTDRVAHDPDVLLAAEGYAREEGMPVEVAMDQAGRYAGEIVPALNACIYFRIGTRLCRRLSTALYRVRLGYSDSDALSQVAHDSTAVFVMNHRSSMDTSWSPVWLRPRRLCPMLSANGRGCQGCKRWSAPPAPVSSGAMPVTGFIAR